MMQQIVGGSEQISDFVDSFTGVSRVAMLLTILSAHIKTLLSKGPRVLLLLLPWASIELAIELGVIQPHAIGSHWLL